MSTSSCAVCLKHKTLENLPGGSIYSDELVFIAHFPLISTEPAHLGHVILEMQRHITSPAQITDAEAAAVGRWTQKIVQAQEQTLGATHVYVLRIGDVTPHLHFHFVPRYFDTPREQWGPLLFRWPGGPKADAATMRTLSEKLRSSLL